MNNRLKEIRKRYKFTQAEMGQEIGVSRDAIATYESGRVVPDKSIRLLICQKFNVNVTWLETGEGSPYKEGLIPALSQALQAMPDVAAALERLLPRMSAEDFEHLNALIKHVFSEEATDA